MTYEVLAREFFREYEQQTVLEQYTMAPTAAQATMASYLTFKNSLIGING